MSENKLVRAECMVNLARHAYNEWNLAMAAAEGNRQINKCFKMQDLCKAVESVVNAAPAVDAVEVVRCKDCIHYDMGVCLKIYSDGNVSADAWQKRNPDDFCSYGNANIEKGRNKNERTEID